MSLYNQIIYACWKFSLVVLILLFISGCLSNKEDGASSSSEDAKYEIVTLSRTFLPPQLVFQNFSDTAEELLKRGSHILVQFWNIPSFEEREALSQFGLQLQEYVDGTAYICLVIKENAASAETALPLIRWMGGIEPNDKLTPALLEQTFEDWAIDAGSGRLKIFVQFYADVDAERVQEALGSLSIEAELYGANNTWQLMIEENLLDTLANLESVKRIQLGPGPDLYYNADGRTLIQTDVVQNGKFTSDITVYKGLTGKDVRVGICDSGIDQLQNDFVTITAAGKKGSPRVYNIRLEEYGIHGTHVASIVGGNGYNSKKNGYSPYSLRGHAPETLLGDYPHFRGQIKWYYQAVVIQNTDITNHSYPLKKNRFYDLEAQSIDMIIRGDATYQQGSKKNRIPSRPQVWAAGNNGTCKNFKMEKGYYSIGNNPKNAIVVGAVDTKDGRLSEFSSLGPTLDGRIKPDVVAPGAYNSVIELGCEKIGDPYIDKGILASKNVRQEYTDLCGTSMAAPVVSAMLALMMQQDRQVHGRIRHLLPSTYKAILIHSAKDQVKSSPIMSRDYNNPDTRSPVLYYKGPDYATGYGLVDAPAAVNLIKNQKQWLESSISRVSEIDEYYIMVRKKDEAVKVVLVWDDEAGPVNAGDHTEPVLINDLDLKVIASGKTHLPWILDPLPVSTAKNHTGLDPIKPNDVKPASRGIDRRNNVEMVSVTGAKGILKIQVLGYTLKNGNPQSYSIVSSHPISKTKFNP